MKSTLLATTLLAVLAAACEDPATPSRRSIYSFADTFNGGRQVFQWPATWHPVRYYARPEGPLPTLTRRGLARWEAQFLYAEFRAVVVSDSTDADVVVAFESGPPPDAEPDTTSTAPACEGVTTFVVDTTNTLERPLRVVIRWFTGFDASVVAACLDRVVSHELGHTLGLFNRSHAGADSTDLMYAFPRVYRPSARDRSTVEVLYHTPPTIAPPRR